MVRRPRPVIALSTNATSPTNTPPVATPCEPLANKPSDSRAYVVIFGSALDNPAKAKDLDVMYGYMTKETAIDILDKYLNTAGEKLKELHLPLDLRDGAQHEHTIGLLYPNQPTNEIYKGKGWKTKYDEESLSRFIRWYATEGEGARPYLNWSQERFAMSLTEEDGYMRNGQAAIRAALAKVPESDLGNLHKTFPALFYCLNMNSEEIEKHKNFYPAGDVRNASVYFEWNDDLGHYECRFPHARCPVHILSR